MHRWSRRSMFTVALLLGVACRGEDRADATAAPSASADLVPRLASAYTSPWGLLGWDSRHHNTITFEDQKDTTILRCTVKNSPEIDCRWSRRQEHDPSSWDRGKATVALQPDGSLLGTWGEGDSDRDRGPLRLVPTRID